jgi:hypothetical protein
MVSFSATITRFGQQGEKTGWTYILVPAAVAKKINPGVKKSYRVKGKLDNYAIKQVALIPMGEGDFIMALNAAMRKGMGKGYGDKVNLQLTLDIKPILPPKELLECFEDEPGALKYYNSLPQGHRNYFTKWIEAAKTDATKTKRIAMVVDAMSKQIDFGQMLRDARERRKELGY